MSKPMDCHHPAILDLLGALGIEIKGTVSVEIRVAVDEIVTITQKRHVTEPSVIDVTNLDSTCRVKALERFKTEIVKWRLERVDQPLPVAPKDIGGIVR